MAPTSPVRTFPSACAAHEYQRGFVFDEQLLVEVLLHGAVDLCNAGVRVRLLEVDLREYEVQRGGSVPCYLGGLSQYSGSLVYWSHATTDHFVFLPRQASGGGYPLM